MVLFGKQIKKIQETLKKMGPFKMCLGQDLKNWLEDIESGRIQCTTFSNLTMPSCATISQNGGVQNQFFNQL